MVLLLNDNQLGVVAGIALGAEQLIEQTAETVARVPQDSTCVKGIEKG
jgi:hypothetical protein